MGPELNDGCNTFYREDIVFKFFRIKSGAKGRICLTHVTLSHREYVDVGVISGMILNVFYFIIGVSVMRVPNN